MKGLPSSLRQAYHRRGRIHFYRRLAILLHHGITLEHALERLTHTPSRRMPRSWIRRLQETHGELLAVRLQPFLPNDETRLIRAGERSGRLADALESLADHLEHVDKLKRHLWAAVASPLIQTVLLLAAITYMAIRIMPTFLHAAPRFRWHGPALLLVQLSSWLRIPYVPAVLCGCLFALVVGLVWSFDYLTPSWRSWLDRVPPWSLHRLEVGGIWLLSLSALVSSGYRLRAAVEETGSDARPWLRQRISAIAHELTLGYGLGMALSRCGYEFPDPEVIDTLTCLDELPDFSHILEQVAKSWAQEAERVMAREAQLFGVIAYMVLALLLMSFVVGFITLNTQLGAAALTSF